MSKLKKAIERAKETRDGAPLSHKTENVQPLRISLGADSKRAPIETKRTPTERKEIKVTYSKTRVEKIDKELLRKNKILSIFKESQITNQVDILRTQVCANLDKLGGNSIMVTSAHPGEGKTFTAINLGISIAQQLDRTVLIVDTDLRNPWKYHYNFAHDFWGLDTERGLSDYLLEEAEIEELLVNPGIEKLTILPAGKPLTNSAEMLGSERMEKFITETKNRYGLNRICIFDCPALLPYTDPLVLTHLIDGILLVVEAERTTPEDLKKMVKLLEGKPILGIVFNKAKEPSTKDYE
jgi:protein-tyrosine kinase